MKNLLRTFLIIMPCILLIQIYGCISYKKAPKKDLVIAGYVKPFDVIIVPGVPFKNNKWDSIMKARVIWSYILYKNGYAHNVIYSGASVYSPYYEGKIMALYAEQLGIPKEHIFYEIKARHSTENVFYSYLIAKEHHFKSIALASDPFQAGLLKGFMRRHFGTHIYQLPFVRDSLSAYNYLDPIIDASSAKCAGPFISITENESFWQRVKGTLGKDIDWSNYPGKFVEAL